MSQLFHDDKLSTLWNPEIVGGCNWIIPRSGWHARQRLRETSASCAEGEASGMSKLDFTVVGRLHWVPDPISGGRWHFLIAGIVQILSTKQYVFNGTGGSD